MITTPLSPPARRGGCFCCLPPGSFPFISSCEEGRMLLLLAAWVFPLYLLLRGGEDASVACRLGLSPLSPPARRGGCFCCLPPGSFPFISSCEEGRILLLLAAWIFSLYPLLRGGEAGMCRCIILKLVRTVPPPCRRGLGGGDLKAAFLFISRYYLSIINASATPEKMVFHPVSIKSVADFAPVYADKGCAPPFPLWL
ncbi:Uncharacterised protein [Candidatus Venteria ishoeyi]|uniref:Uncharacterized protein n=1 Tax=Candidatus Venteria ishoeyi TaxID=1899563 RepID=A0A1H6F548_9GAMM|nr:Uncharacterised protein [Candidatus Venteria ishoeyi]